MDASENQDKCVGIDLFLLVDLARELAGIKVYSLKPGERLKVRTASGSEYNFVMTDPKVGEATVTGGARFLVPTPVQINGASMGGSVIEYDTIRVGWSMEIFRKDTAGKRVRPLITSPVTTIHLYP